MSHVIEMQSELQETQALLAHLEQAAKKNPSSVGLRINGQSVAKRFRELEQEFQRLTADARIDVCRYRLFASQPSESTSAAAVAGAVLNFQRVFSTAYDAIKHGPRKQAKIPEDVARESKLGWGYSFAGSVGIAMTLSNPQLLMESALDDAVHAVFDLAKSDSAAKVVKASASLGGPTVRALYDWVEQHIADDTGIDVQWCRGNLIKDKLSLQMPELKRLSAILAEASEPIEETVTLVGKMEGCEHMSSRRVHFIADDGLELKCPYKVGLITESNPLPTPARYKATFSKKAKKVIATDEDADATYMLIHFEQIH